MLEMVAVELTIIITYYNLVFSYTLLFPEARYMLFFVNLPSGNTTEFKLMDLMEA
jgi:hypothetical protein